MEVKPETVRVGLKGRRVERPRLEKKRKSKGKRKKERGGGWKERHGMANRDERSREEATLSRGRKSKKGKKGKERRGKGRLDEDGL